MTDDKDMDPRDMRIEIHDDHRQGHGYSEKIKTVLDPREKTCQLNRHLIFLICCVVAASLDPLFFYVPIINDHKKCLEMDKKLETTMVVLRSVFDLTFLFRIIFQIISGYFAYTSENGGLLPRSNNFIDRILGVIRRIKWRNVIIDILCVLPIPQLVILIYFPKTEGPQSLNARKILNFLVLFQYVPRILSIFLSCKEVANNMNPEDIVGAALPKGLFNLFLYIIASHVFGAFWYFFSVDRELACWQKACKGNSICNETSFFCKHRNHIVDDPIIGYLNVSCSLVPPSSIDFGMFAPALQSRIVNTKDFPRKSFYCFAWGLRNLSSFGSNLQTGAFFWESLFSAAITVIGLLLFIYLIGNLQTYLRFSAKHSEKSRRKMKLKGLEIDIWIQSNGIPPDMRNELMDCVRRKMKQNEDVNLKNLLHVLPAQSKKRIKQILCSHVLKKVPRLQEMIYDESIDEIFIDHLKPVILDEHNEIFREGGPLDRMLFFTQGSAWAYTTGDTTPIELERGDFYGEELLEWALTAPSSPIPISQKTVKTNTKVEAFELGKQDMKKIVNSWWSLRKLSLTNSTNIPKKRWGAGVVSVIQHPGSSEPASNDDELSFLRS